jgi:hypothetical protein
MDKSQLIGIGSGGTVVYNGTYLGKEAAIKRIRKIDLVEVGLTREIEIMKTIN